MDVAGRLSGLGFIPKGSHAIHSELSMAFSLEAVRLTLTLNSACK